VGVDGRSQSKKDISRAAGRERQVERQPGRDGQRGRQAETSSQASRINTAAAEAEAEAEAARLHLQLPLLVLEQRLVELTRRRSKVVLEPGAAKQVVRENVAAQRAGRKDGEGRVHVAQSGP
jgi:hypothetical protein